MRFGELGVLLNQQEDAEILVNHFEMATHVINSYEFLIIGLLFSPFFKLGVGVPIGRYSGDDWQRHKLLLFLL